MSAPTTSARIASDGVEAQAFAASHRDAKGNTGTALADAYAKIAHLESVAERQADQRRIDSLRIQELEGKYAGMVETGKRLIAIAAEDQQRALGRIDHWRGMYHTALDARDAAAAKIADMADERDALNARLESIRTELGETDGIVQELTRRSEVQARDYRECREALTLAEDQRDGYRRQLGAKLAELDGLRAKLRTLALES